MPKSRQENAMTHRFALWTVLLLSVPLMVPSAALCADSYRLEPYGVGAKFAVSTIDYVWLDAGRNRSVPVRIYYPADSGKAAALPVIIFSTGLGHSRDDCAYLGRHWASCGYVSVHVQHPGSDEEVRRESVRPRKDLQRAFYAPQNIRNRPMDIIFVIDRLGTSGPQAVRRPADRLRPGADRRGRARFWRADRAGPGRRSAAGRKWLSPIRE